MIRRSKGVQEFAQPIAGWVIRSQIRFINESGRDVHSIVSPDWCPISPVEPVVPQKELTPWIPVPKMATLASWDRDFWMTKPISNVYSHRQLLMEIYDVLTDRDEEQFYKEYAPIKWCYSEEVVWKYLNETLDKFKYDEHDLLLAGNFALSDEPVSKMLRNQAHKLKIVVDHPSWNRTILWARKDMLLQTASGAGTLAYLRRLGDKALRYGVPRYEEF